MQELELNWQRAAKVWWLIVWRWSLGGILIGALMGFLVTLHWRNGLTFLSVVIAYVAAIVWSIMVVQMALKKRYAHFRIALLPRDLS